MGVELDDDDKDDDDDNEDGLYKSKWFIEYCCTDAGLQ